MQGFFCCLFYFENNLVKEQEVSILGRGENHWSIILELHLKEQDLELSRDMASAGERMKHR